MPASLFPQPTHKHTFTALPQGAYQPLNSQTMISLSTGNGYMKVHQNRNYKNPQWQQCLVSNHRLASYFKMHGRWHHSTRSIDPHAVLVVPGDEDELQKATGDIWITVLLWADVGNTLNVSTVDLVCSIDDKRMIKRGKCECHTHCIPLVGLSYILTLTVTKML